MVGKIKLTWYILPWAPALTPNFGSHAGIHLLRRVLWGNLGIFPSQQSFRNSEYSIEFLPVKSTVTMCPDPVCPFVSLLLLIDLINKYHDLTEKWHEYEDFLTKASAVISALDSDRNQLSRNLIVGSWDKVDEDIRVAKSALAEARKLLSWQDETWCKAKLEIAVKYRAATRNQELLEKYLAQLQPACQRLATMKTYLNKREEYLQETRKKTSAALARQFLRHVIM